MLDKLYVFLLIAFLFSCSKSDRNDYVLIQTNKQLLFELDSNTKNELFNYSIYKDEIKSYFTFQSPGTNRILFYDLESQQKEFEINPSIDGNNGVGLVNGFYVYNLDSIYIPNFDFKEISLINKSCTVKDKYNYEKDENGQELSINYYSSAYQRNAEKIGRYLYLYSGPNRFIEKDPVTIKFDMDTHKITALPFNYPDYPGSDTKLKKYGLETAFSRCYDQKRFIYSFYYDENIYVASIDHQTIQKIPVKSKYFDKVVLPGELTGQPNEFCENPWYGNLLYDKYRNVYYRIAYPQTTIEKGIRPMELLGYGRKNFSIIILDDNFQKIGETLFPDYIYNSRIMFILEDGLYISDSHYLNPNFSDDVLSFRRFELVKE